VAPICAPNTYGAIPDCHQYSINLPLIASSSVSYTLLRLPLCPCVLPADEYMRVLAPPLQEHGQPGARVRAEGEAVGLTQQVRHWGRWGMRRRASRVTHPTPGIWC
jgi:hypothetical protein